MEPDILKLKAELYNKMELVTNSIPYLKAEGKGLNGKVLEIKVIYHHMKETMHNVGLKLSTELIDVKHREILKEKDRGGTQLLLITEADLLFTWCDTKTGYSEEKKFKGSWVNYDNYGFAIGSILTYFKRQYLMQELSIETDEADPDVYEKKFESAEEAAARVEEEMKKKIEFSISQMRKSKTVKELSFALNSLPENLRFDENVEKVYIQQKESIIVKAINQAKSKDELDSILIASSKDSRIRDFTRLIETKKKTIK